MTDRNGHPDRNGSPAKGQEAAILRAIEAPETPAGEVAGNLGVPLDGLRADRLALRASADVAAPAGLLDAAMDEAETLGERELLLGLAPGSDADAPLPVSKVIPMKDRLMDRVFDRPMRWAVAAAAGLLIALGAGAAILAGRLQDRFTNADPAPLIADNQPAETPGVARPEMGAPSIDDGTALATSQPGEGEPAVLPPEPTQPAVVTLAAATRLMQEGRLAIRVQPAAAGGDGLAMLDAVRTGRADRLDATWTVQGAAGEAIAAAMPVLANPVPSPDDQADPTAIASTDPSMTDPVVRTPQGAGREPAIERLGVYTARLDRRGTALASLGAGLERGGFTVEYIALDAPAPEPLVLDAESVRWWSRPASMWPDSAVVPLIVEAER